MSKHGYRHGQAFVQHYHALELGILIPAPPGYRGRHHLPDVRFSQELPDATVYWSPNRKAFFRRDDNLPSGWVQRIYPRVATSFRTAE
ncbi:hypothetical protein PBI_TURJ99_40 [Mycobacterium phage Turj99]|uniref:hypothetical protein n=1 Tax=Mycobacterium phage Turj99 TaxID=1701849 RepID=UPI0006CE2FFD|nr:hypothetical protein PBI_TURJ99_40 [Mycobacterium phage Turj99]ALF02634.1 hypothetical protein PBI_TURJ99_40 [Mycobacterium phage Turj99]AOT27634.1 hypothetical protein SEA_MAGNITO_40 [Mycobacterium phage Magnito]AXC38196.1 hypothetical protein SEA_NIZA_44 [Mycobacterium phage Niza]